MVAFVPAPPTKGSSFGSASMRMPLPALIRALSTTSFTPRPLISMAVERALISLPLSIVTVPNLPSFVCIMMPKRRELITVPSVISAEPNPVTISPTSTTLKVQWLNVSSESPIVKAP